MKKIKLTQGKYALVDDEDFEELNKHKWYAQKLADTGNWFALRAVVLGPRKDGKFPKTVVWMHREILNMKQGDRKIAKHVKRNKTLDNRRNNLYVVKPMTRAASAMKWRDKDRVHARAVALKSQDKLCPSYSACKSYRAMIFRCYNPKADRYPRYGGRGIRVCDRWLSKTGKASVAALRIFEADMGPRPDGTTLHRVCKNGDYEPGNCVWSLDHAEPCSIAA